MTRHTIPARAATDDPLGVLPRIVEIETQQQALDLAVALLSQQRAALEHELSELRFVRYQQHVADRETNRRTA